MNEYKTISELRKTIASYVFEELKKNPKDAFSSMPANLELLIKLVGSLAN